MVLAFGHPFGEKYANGIASLERVPGTSSDPQGQSSSPEGDLSVKLFDRVLNPREIRRRLGLNQEQFWTQIGVTQSGGSRYESGREMPKPVRELLRLVHVEQIDLSQVKRVDFEIISYLKESHADLYRTLRRAVKGRNRAGGAPLVLDDAALGDVSQPAEMSEAEVAIPGAEPKGSHSL
jgi:transcriptional regulator with XRE-family HTH domain